jgi:hypothetical protein
MKAKIYKYTYNTKVYYAEGFEEANVKLTLENYLQIKPGSLDKGTAPDFNTELKLIWDKRIKTHVLTLTLDQTTSRAELSSFKKKQHCLYELMLLLREDKSYLNGFQGHVKANEANNVKYWNSKYIKNDGSEIGEEMCYSFRDSTDPDDIAQIYRFKNMFTAYNHVRAELIKYELADIKYNANFTNIEMCDSFIAGFGNADLYLDNGNIKVKTPYSNYTNKDMNYVN